VVALGNGNPENGPNESATPTRPALPMPCWYHPACLGRTSASLNQR
jgi:hypothetical protein